MQHEKPDGQSSGERGSELRLCETQKQRLTELEGFSRGRKTGRRQNA